MNWEARTVLVLVETGFASWNLHIVEKHINLSLISCKELGSTKSRRLIAVIKV